MRSAVLPLVTFGLFAMVVADRISHALAASADRTVEESTESRTETLEPVVPGAPHGSSNTRSAGALAPSTPTTDRLARLAVRQQISREAGRTYLDSLVITTDSVVRRWADRSGVPLRVALIEGGPPEYHPRMARLFMEALYRWENTGMGVRFDAVRGCP
jgi:hypothetical protein